MLKSANMLKKAPKITRATNIKKNKKDKTSELTMLNWSYESNWNCFEQFFCVFCMTSSELKNTKTKWTTEMNMNTFTLNLFVLAMRWGYEMDWTKHEQKCLFVCIIVRISHILYLYLYNVRVVSCWDFGWARSVASNWTHLRNYQWDTNPCFAIRYSLFAIRYEPQQVEFFRNFYFEVCSC